jgi:hypothetical protein
LVAIANELLRLCSFVEISFSFAAKMMSHLTNPQSALTEIAVVVRAIKTKSSTRLVRQTQTLRTTLAMGGTVTSRDMDMQRADVFVIPTARDATVTNRTRVWLSEILQHTGQLLFAWKPRSGKTIPEES